MITKEAIEAAARAACEDNVQRIHKAAHDSGSSASMSGSEHYMYPPHGWPDFLASIEAGITAALAAMPGPAVKVEKHLRHRVTGFRGNPLRVVLSNGEEATISQKLIDSFASPSPFDQHHDDVAVDRFAAAMKEKLAEKRADGFGGWDDPEVCHIDYLVHMLAEQIHSRAVIDTVDIGNFAMMIFNRGETPSHGR